MNATSFFMPGMEMMVEPASLRFFRARFESF